MSDAIERELLYASKYDVTWLLNPLRGIASCATQCGCCRMHQEIAAAAVERWEKNLRSG
jgi:hypothetical protein